MRNLRAIAIALALVVTGGIALAASYSFKCNHCSANLTASELGEGTCPDCHHINILARCFYCKHVIAWKSYGQLTCPDCGKSQAVSSCIHCNRVVIGPSWSGWWTCPYEDCGKQTYRYFCKKCGEPMMSNQESDLCIDCQ